MSKSFGGQPALRDVALDLRVGEVHGLVGQNGSGKSTLIKVLAGYHRPDGEPRIRFFGEEASLARHGHATEWRRQVHFIHQDLALIESLNAVENLALEQGVRKAFAGRISWRRERERARDIFADFGVELDLRMPVGRLGRADRTMVAIVRALQGWPPSGSGVLVLDEPTVSLSEREIERLFVAVRQVAARGGAVLFVSHRLEEIFDIADRATVLRNGEVVDTAVVSELDAPRLIEMIVGRRIEEFYAELPPPQAELVLELKGVSGTVVENLSLGAHRGEVVGIGGLTGSGRDEVMELIFGSRPRLGGEVLVAGSPLPASDPRASIKRGVSLVPSDRTRNGIIAGFPLRENLTLSNLSVLSKGRWRLWKLSRRRELDAVKEWVERLSITPGEPERPVGTLSGGNQQKAVIARSLRVDPVVWLLDEPTQGVDVGSRAQIYELIAAAAREGVCVALASSHPAELANVCDRVLVMRDGVVGAELSADALSEERVARETLRVPGIEGEESQRAPGAER